MKTETQFCIFLENIPERIADICASLALEGINVQGLSISDAMDYGVARLTVDDPHTARGILQESHYAFTEVLVLSLEIPNNPGALADMVRSLIRENVTIEYAYTTATVGGDRGRVVLRAQPLEKALAVLQQQQMAVA